MRARERVHGLSLASRVLSVVGAGLLVVLIWFVFPAVRDLWTGTATLPEVSSRIEMGIGAAVGMLVALMLISWLDWLIRKERELLFAARKAHAAAVALAPEPRRPFPKSTRPPHAILDLTHASAVNPLPLPTAPPATSVAGYAQDPDPPSTPPLVIPPL